VVADPAEPFSDRLRLAVAAYLARFKGSSHEHTESDLRCYLAWCAERALPNRVRPDIAETDHKPPPLRYVKRARRRSHSSLR
jgi:integrase/recombinase XerD